MNAESSHEREVCGAMTRSGSPCQRRPVVGRNRCNLHGGKTLVGAASPTFKHGRYSKYLPVRLMGRYAEAIADPDLLAMREDIALLDTRLSELLGRVDTGESGARWAQLAKAWQSFRAADDEDIAEALRAVDGLIEAAVTDYVAWGEIQSIVQQRRQLVESEQKRLVAMQQMVTTEQAMLFVSAVMDAARRTVTSQRDLSAFAAEVAALMSRRAP